MSAQPTGDGPAATIGDQLPAIQSLAALAKMFRGLPAVYLSAHHNDATRIDLQAQSPSDFELWREALQVPPSAVVLHYYAGGSWLELQTVFHGSELYVTGHGLLHDPQMAAVSPAEDAARRQQSALLVHRHELEDPAVPPLAAAGPQPSALERGQAEAEAWNAEHPVGTAVAAFPRTREDEPLLTKTRSKAWPLGQGTVVVQVEGHTGGIALSHVDVLPAAISPAEPIEVRTLADAHRADFDASVAAGYVQLPDWDTAPAPAVADVQTGGAL